MGLIQKVMQIFKWKRSLNTTQASAENAVSIGGNAERAIVATGQSTVIQVTAGEGPKALSITHSLPPDLTDFTGREEDVEALLTQLSGEGGAAAISALDGLGGIGKTALAIHVAHRLTKAFADGQLLFNLGGTREDPDSPVEVMTRVLQALDPMASLPDDEQAISARYRDTLSQNKLLLILDNARDGAQVLPLLPPAPSVAIITSRQPINLPNVKSRPLGVLPPEKAHVLLREIVADRGCTDEELDRIAKACGYLPLALRVAGTFLVLHPAWSPAEYLEELEVERSRLNVLKVADHDLDVAKTLGLSIAQLEREKPVLAQNWRKLSVFPGDFDRAAVAAIWACTEAAARDGLDALMHRTLTLYDGDLNRHRLHDLMRDMARLVMQENGSMPDLAETARRHAQYFCGVLEAADQHYLQGDEQIAIGLALYDREQHNIEAGHTWVVEQMARDSEAARLTHAYTNAGVYVLSLRQHRREAVAWLEAGIKGARLLKDRRAEGNALGNLGIAWVALGEVRKAIKYHEQDLVSKQEVGDRRGEGNALGNLGSAWAALGEAHKAIEYYEQQLDIAREIKDLRGEGNAQGGLGIAWAALGEARKAIEYYEQALVISREIGDRRGEGNALGNLGSAWAALGEAHKAIEYYDQQLDIAREIGDRRGEGNALGGLGNARAVHGKMLKAIKCYRQSFVIHREIGDLRGEGEDLCNLGNAWAALGEGRKAIECYEQALVVSREIGDRRGEGSALFNSAGEFNKLGDQQEAIKQAEAALDIFIAIESPHAGTVRRAIEEWRGVL